ncbi:MAG: glycosyltransferase family 39 protein [Acidobacteria bacterium]|nr:glycosyltransferase family 39 protein [Acidobacteriota bacterium]
MEDNLQGQSTKTAIGIFLLAVLLRLGYVLLRQPSLSGDSGDYLSLAENLIYQQVFSFDGVVPTIRRPPFYPWFLSGICLITGEQPSASVYIITCVQAILDSFVAVIVFQLSRITLALRFALGAGIFYAICPGVIDMTRHILSETIFTSLLACMMLCLLWGIKSGKSSLFIIAGVLLGSAILSRSIAILLIPILGALIVILTRSSRRILYGTIFAVATALVIAPWIIRSSAIANRFVLIQGASAVNFYTPTLVDIDQGNEDALWSLIFKKETRDPYGNKLTSAKTAAEILDADRIGFKVAWQNIAARPSDYLRSRIHAYPHLFLNSFDSFTGINAPFATLWQSKQWLKLLIKVGLLFVFSLLPFVAALFGVIKMRMEAVTGIIASIWIYFLLIHVPMWIEFRFWLPATPFLIVSAFQGAQSLFLLTEKRYGSSTIGLQYK